MIFKDFYWIIFLFASYDSILKVKDIRKLNFIVKNNFPYFLNL